MNGNPSNSLCFIEIERTHNKIPYLHNKTAIGKHYSYLLRYCANDWKRFKEEVVAASEEERNNIQWNASTSASAAYLTMTMRTINLKLEQQQTQYITQDKP